MQYIENPALDVAGWRILPLSPPALTSAQLCICFETHAFTLRLTCSNWANLSQHFFRPEITRVRPASFEKLWDTIDTLLEPSCSQQLGRFVVVPVGNGCTHTSHSKLKAQFSDAPASFPSHPILHKKTNKNEIDRRNCTMLPTRRYYDLYTQSMIRLFLLVENTNRYNSVKPLYTDLHLLFTLMLPSISQTYPKP